MKLIDFELSKPSYAIELIGLDFLWDLHNAASFLCLDLNANDNTVTMKWSVQGHPASKYSGCNLVFGNLKFIVISPRDEQMPLSEDACISGISKVVPDSTRAAKYRTKSNWDSTDPFNLFFEFQSGRSIEIDAEVVKLVGVAKPA